MYSCRSLRPWDLVLREFRPPSRGARALPKRPVRVYDTGRPVKRSTVRPSAAGLPRGEPRLTEHLIGQLGYVGIALILILGGLGLPIPEEAPYLGLLSLRVNSDSLSSSDLSAVKAGNKSL